ncbi:MAG: hypothetical protein HYY58_05635 [Candidatus Omnitrophica bacterium]|nr:hypothetical protein [Candidatus Omnitrophota bacterium]MBI3011950.1 hypothetical protein [Candidatus Omnitrophota bacterium]
MSVIGLIAPLIGSLRRTIPFVERRTEPASDRYFEAVLLRQDLDRCCGLLRKVFGQPLKDFGEPVRLEPKVQNAIDLLGGVRFEQCLFVVKDETQQAAAYAALWPWASDGTRVTLKVGLVELR